MTARRKQTQTGYAVRSTNIRPRQRPPVRKPATASVNQASSADLRDCDHRKLLGLREFVEETLIWMQLAGARKADFQCAIGRGAWFSSASIVA